MLIRVSSSDGNQVIPILEEVDVEKLENAFPVGMLLVNIKSARKLKVGDLRSSDPYVIVRLGINQKFQTKVKSMTLNPDWNEEFRFEVRRRKMPGSQQPTHATTNLSFVCLFSFLSRCMTRLSPSSSMFVTRT